ncbi:MAG: twin-arginine translocase TatA/TatE family subunit [Phascolarctobacterium sp.]|uniref:Sec-independent protein translocase subunit TatA/TatB n=1 Tax=Phascolarctobacterium sp. TaxID=2049039 RepID=UPI0026DBB62B|nr:twin-arginine translocase TatA/TatE family subunit [Phascolarctobacterium sp.]MDO4920645.1 twin-arginine translocase TatA/TatE family subunit [Phascolarctobacterium sp.]
MFGLGLPELLLILVIGLVFFGPGKLPDVGKAIGKSMREFKTALNTDEPEAKKESAKDEAVAAEAKEQKNENAAQ